MKLLNGLDKMKFNGGMLGVLAVVLALLGTIILGTVLSIEETETHGTGYRNVADITGLVSTSTDPYFTDYNPSKNWTGYWITETDANYISGVDYTTTTQANNYPVMTGTPVITSTSLNLDSIPEGARVPSGYDELKIFTSNNYSSGTAYWSNPQITTLAQVVNAIKTRTTTEITIYGASTDSHSSPSRAIIPAQTPGYSATPFYPDSGSKSITGNVMSWGLGSFGSEQEHRYLTGTWTVDIGTMTATSKYPTNSSYWKSYPADTVLVVWGGSGVDNGAGYTPGAIPSTIYAEKTDSDIRYMDVTKGVKLNTYAGSDNTVWGNGYWNGTLNMVLKGTPGASINMSVPVSSWDGSAWSNPVNSSIRINWNSTGDHSTHIIVDGTDKNLGTWNNILLSIDLEKGQVNVSPITSFSGYTNYTTGATSLVNTIPKGAVNQITYIPVSGATAPDMEIISSRVYMDTYGAVFKDADLDPSTYFPDTPRYAVDFGNFALIGSSITINGISLPVSGDSITYNEKTYSLKDAAVVYDGNVFLKGNDYNIDLGEKVSGNIHFTGIWYVPLTFQEVYTTDTSSYEWVPFGFGFDYNTAVLVFIGLIIAVMFIAPLMKTKPKTLDWVVVVFAGFIAAGLLVV